MADTLETTPVVNTLETTPIVNPSVDPVPSSQVLQENASEVENSTSTGSIANSEESSDSGVISTEPSPEESSDSEVVGTEPVDQNLPDPMPPSDSTTLRIIRAKSYDDLPDLFKQHDNLFFKTALNFKSGDPIDIWFEVITDPSIAELVSSINSARSLLLLSGLNLRGL